MVGQRLELGLSDFRGCTCTSTQGCFQGLWAVFCGQGREHEGRVGRRDMLCYWIIWAQEGEDVSAPSGWWKLFQCPDVGPGGYYGAVKALFAYQEAFSLSPFQVRGISTSAKLDTLIISDILTAPTPTVPWDSPAHTGLLQERR